MIELRNVSFSYWNKSVLHDVSFSVQDEELLVIMGPSGSGKSTILRLILGLECTSKGEVLVDGQNICAMKEKDKRKIRKTIGMVFQDGALFDSLRFKELLPFFKPGHACHQFLFDSLDGQLEFLVFRDEVLGGVDMDLLQLAAKFAGYGVKFYDAL